MTPFQQHIPGRQQPKAGESTIAVGDGVRRILIINDDWSGSIDDMFKNSGVSAEVKLVRTIQEAITQLEAWAKTCKRADVITIDCYKATGPNIDDIVPVGREYQWRIEKWSACQNEQIRPEKLFWHSYCPNITPPSGVGLHHTSELEFISAVGSKRFGACSPANEMPLCEYLNQIWRTGLPTNQEQLLLLAIDMGALRPHSLPKRVGDGELSEKDALRGVDVSYLFLDSTLDTTGATRVSEKFDSHSEGAATGVLAFDEQDVKRLAAEGKSVILIVDKLDASHMSLVPNLAGFVALSRNTETEHAKHIFDAHGIPALFGDKDRVFAITKGGNGEGMLARLTGEQLDKPEYTLVAGASISIGIEGFFPQALPVRVREVQDHESVLAKWAANLQRSHGGMVVKANADTPEQVTVALEHGAAGIGLVRTEHMFFFETGLAALRHVLCTPNAQTLATFKEVQQAQFYDLLRAAQGSQLPVTVRLLDAPPDEFLSSQEVSSLIDRVGRDNARGARFALKTVGLYPAQLEALIKAAKAVKFGGVLEVMIPLVYRAEELKTLKAECQPIFDSYVDEADCFSIRFGAMIETISAVEEAEEIAKLSDFVSFGTNDLTAEIIGGKRQDLMAAQRWMMENACEASPYRSLTPEVFAVIDQALQVMKLANPSLEIRICGDQVSGNFRSIELCSHAGFNSISVRPTANVLTVSRIMVGKLRAMSL